MARQNGLESNLVLHRTSQRIVITALKELVAYRELLMLLLLLYGSTRECEGDEGLRRSTGCQKKSTAAA